MVGLTVESHHWISVCLPTSVPFLFVGCHGDPSRPPAPAETGRAGLSACPPLPPPAPAPEVTSKGARCRYGSPSLSWIISLTSGLARTCSRNLRISSLLAR